MSEASAIGAVESSRGAQWLGLAMVGGGSVMLAFKGIFAKLLYAQGLGSEAVVATRAVLAIPGFVLIALLHRGAPGTRPASARDYLGAMFAGLACYYAGASLNFHALTLIDASVERALLFSYPAIVVMAAWAISGARPSPNTALAVGATWLGIALVVGLTQYEQLVRNLEGSIYVLICSATIALYFMLSERLTRTLGSGRFTVVAMTTAGFALAVHYQVRHGWAGFGMSDTAWSLMGALVVFSTVLPLYLIAEGLRRVGAQRGAVVSTVGPPATALSAAIILGERLSIAQLAGMLLIILGILRLEWRRGAR